MTKGEAIEELKLFKESAIPWDVPILLNAIDMAIEALKNKSRPFGDCSKCIHTYGTLGCCTTVSNEWVYDCEHGMEQYKSTKAEPSEDGTLEVKVEDATKIGRVLIADDKHRGGLYYPDEDEPKGDLISRAEAIEAMGEEPPVWCDEEYEIAERDQWRADIEAIKSVPSADRPIDEFDGMIFSTDKYMAFIDKKEIHIMRKDAHKIAVERMFNTEEDEE